MTNICKNLKSVEGKFKFVVSKSVKLNSKFKRSIYTSKKSKKRITSKFKKYRYYKISTKGFIRNIIQKIINKKFSKNLNVTVPSPLKKSFLI